MATVEEIVVKFTGDASGMATATDRARHKVRELEERILKMGQLLERAKPGSRAFEANSSALTGLVKKYGEASDKLQREVAKIEKLEMRAQKAIYASLPNTAKLEQAKGGRGGSGAFGGGFAGSLIGSVLNSLTTPMWEMSQSLFSQAEKSFIPTFLPGQKGPNQSIAQAEREVGYEDERSSFLSRMRARQISDQEESVGRESIGRDSKFQLQAQINLQKSLQKQIDDSKNSQKFFRKEIEDSDSAFHQLRPSMKMRFNEAQKGLKEEIKHYENLEAAVHGVSKKIKDMRVNMREQKWQETQQAREGLADRGRSMTERALLLANPNMDSDDIAMMRAREDVRKRIERDNPNDTAANREKMIANELEQLEAQYRRLKEAKKDAFEMDFVRGQEQRIRAFGKTAGEAFLLQQRALGKEVAPDRAAQILGNENQMRAMDLQRQLENPFERGQREMQELEAIRGNLDSETYYRAVARIQKGMQGPGPAASRAATGFGSAEHTARILQYQRVLDEPQAMANNIERVNREKPPEGKGQSEANTYLRQIRDKITKTPAVELRPANLGG